MTGNHLENMENSPEASHSGNSLNSESQPNSFQNNLFERISLGIFILVGGLAYLFNFPSGTLFTTAGILMLLICLRQIISKSLTLDWLILLIGFLCLSKGISTLFNFEITFIPLVFCLLGIFIISKALQDRSA
ncbi:hypothetical protein F925_02930 [Acinetobacter lwoffii NCTC 5866 = CIP 64.10 = NIPH 512]|nr:hypothetical protein F925_02930 [Acinetobacter lwoffii NCTC 5866 = CIP 64.10 = NIPH 512]